MNISDIIKIPVGGKFGGLDVVMKTCKKRWKVGSKWMQQVVLSDETGDTLADINVVKNIPLQRGSVLHIVVGMIQAGVAEVGKPTDNRIYIDQFELPSTIGEPEINYSMTDKITRSKIKCWLVSACLQGDPSQLVDRCKIDGLVNYIME